MQQPRYSPALPGMRPQIQGSRAPHPSVTNVSNFYIKIQFILVYAPLADFIISSNI